MFLIGPELLRAFTGTKKPPEELLRSSRITLLLRYCSSVLKAFSNTNTVLYTYKTNVLPYVVMLNLTFLSLRIKRNYA